MLYKGSDQASNQLQTLCTLNWLQTESKNTCENCEEQTKSVLSNIQCHVFPLSSTRLGTLAQIYTEDQKIVG